MLSSDIGASQDRLPAAEAKLYLEEFTHRTLNDYTILLAIVRRAARNISDEAAEIALKEISHRLRAAATSLIALRPPADGLLRDLSRELEPLCASLSDSIMAYGRIALALSSEPVAISAYRCWQLSLIISELVTNAARHAFANRRNGLINVITAVRGGTIECAVADNGGCKPDFAPGRGTMIVNALVSDLGGAITRNHSVNGSTIVISIPLAEAFFSPTKTKPASKRAPSTVIHLPDLGAYK